MGIEPKTFDLKIQSWNYWNHPDTNIAIPDITYRMTILYIVNLALSARLSVTFTHWAAWHYHQNNLFMTRQTTQFYQWCFDKILEISSRTHRNISFCRFFDVSTADWLLFFWSSPSFSTLISGNLGDNFPTFICLSAAVRVSRMTMERIAEAF